MKPKEVDFSEARAFDEEDRIRRESDSQNGTMKIKKWDPVQTIKNIVFG